MVGSVERALALTLRPFLVTLFLLSTNLAGYSSRFVELLQRTALSLLWSWSHRATQEVAQLRHTCI